MSEASWGFIRPERNKSRDEGDNGWLDSEIEREGESAENVQIVVQIDGQKILLNEFVPEGTKFQVEGMHYLCGRNKGEERFTVILPERPFDEFGRDNVHGRLALLHEMGHVRTGIFPSLLEVNKAAKARAESILIEIRTDYRKIIDKFHIDQSSVEWKNFVEKEFPERWAREETAYVGSGVNPTYENLLSFVHSLAKNERDAWANALRIQRQIKKEKGVDILEGASKDEIFKFIYDRALGSYEDEYGFLFSETEREGEVRSLEDEEDSPES